MFLEVVVEEKDEVSVKQKRKIKKWERAGQMGYDWIGLDWIGLDRIGQDTGGEENKGKLRQGKERWKRRKPKIIQNEDFLVKDKLRQKRNAR